MGDGDRVKKDSSCFHHVFESVVSDEDTEDAMKRATGFSSLGFSSSDTAKKGRGSDHRSSYHVCNSSDDETTIGPLFLKRTALGKKVGSASCFVGSLLPDRSAT